jgi:hypothetical protein
MRRRWENLIALLMVAACSSCCEQQYNHSVRRMWCDYNSFREPALSFEQVDHLPYCAPQVGYYRWMYDKDPGHQLAALGPVVPPTPVVPQCVPTGDNPFEYQVEFPTGIPAQTDTLWGEKQPEPINVARELPIDGPKFGPPSAKETQPPTLTVPMAPVLAPPANRRPNSMSPPPSKTTLQPSPEPPGAPLPGLESAPPPPRPVDEDVPPMLGPGAQDNPNLRLTTGAPGAQAASGVSGNALWPR